MKSGRWQPLACKGPAAPLPEEAAPSAAGAHSPSCLRPGRRAPGGKDTMKWEALVVATLLQAQVPPAGKAAAATARAWEELCARGGGGGPGGPARTCVSSEPVPPPSVGSRAGRGPASARLPGKRGDGSEAAASEHTHSKCGSFQWSEGRGGQGDRRRWAPGTGPGLDRSWEGSKNVSQAGFHAVTL